MGDHAPTPTPDPLFYCRFGLLSVAKWPHLHIFSQCQSDFCFHQVAKSVIIIISVTNATLFCFLHWLLIWLEQPVNSLSFVCSNGIQHISEGSKYKCNCRRNSNYGGGDSSVVRAPDSWLKGRGFESLLERRENYLLQGRLSVLTLISVSVPPPCYHSST